MTIKETEVFIRKNAKEHVAGLNEKISWSLHAVTKLRIEGFQKKDIEESLKECIIVEDYVMADHCPDAWYLALSAPRLSML